MADKTTLPPSGSGDSGERRTVPPRSTGGYDERPTQQIHSGSSYGERPQSTRTGGYGTQPQSTRSTGERPPSRSTSPYGERSQSSRSAGGYGERRPAAPRSAGSSSGRQSSPRRADVIRCENCGEDYSVTYKRCPFCDERPGRGGVAGKRVANTRGGGYGRPVNPIQSAGLVVSLALIASALFIVFRFVGAPIFGGRKPNNSSQSNSSSQSSSQSQKGSQSSVSSGNNSIVVPPALQSISLNNNDATVNNGATLQMTADLLPAGAVGDVTWTSSDVTAATVDSTGLVTNVNTGSSDVKVTITATCGDVSAETSLTCKGKGGGTAAVGSRGRIVNAEKGLNIRSGPGKEHPVVASAQNGASITILGEENGYYKINYSGDNIGYVSKDYVSVG